MKRYPMWGKRTQIEQKLTFFLLKNCPLKIGSIYDYVHIVYRI